MLLFNQRGHLIPASALQSDLDEFKDVFVDKFSSQERKDIFERYIKYARDLKNLCGAPYLQWINGSFCTLKPNPRDIDLVSFIPHSIIDGKENEFRRFSYPNSETEFGVDAYIVKTYTSGNNRYPQYQGDRLYWLDYFSKNSPQPCWQSLCKRFCRNNVLNLL